MGNENSRAMTLADHIRKKDLISAAKLIKHDDGINARNSKGESGLHAALETGTTDIFLVLISKGAEMHPELPHDRNALHVAVDKGHLHLAKAILSNHRQFSNFKNQSDSYGWTPLHIAAMRGNADMIQLLIKYNAQVEVRDTKGRTPQDVAVLHNHGPEVHECFQQEEFEVRTPHTALGKSRDSSNPNADAPTASFLYENEEVEPLEFIHLYMQKHAVNIPIIQGSELSYSQQVNKGSSCIVYKGRWRGTEIGIKEFKPEYKTTRKEMEKFLKELVTLSQIRHPNLLLLMGVCLDRPNLCIITEYVNNFTLFYALHRNNERKLNFDDRLSIAIQICRALAYLHSNTPPIMHRDLKPENILLDAHLNVRIADFGLAMPQSLVSQVSSLSQLCIGTTRFMAPELFDKDLIKNIGVETDIWSLGCMLIEIFSNKRPWDYINSQNVNNVYYEICKRRQIPIPETIPIEIRQLIYQCCDYDPRKRPTAQASLSHLENLLT